MSKDKNEDIRFRAYDFHEKVFTHFSLYDLIFGDVSGKLHEEMAYDRWTGLLDKNGREIYEGDILKSESMTVLMSVKWYGESAGFNLGWIKGHNVTVNGNIYEGELLKEAT